MATTVSAKAALANWPLLITPVELTTINPGETVDAAHGGPTGARVLYVTHETTVEATSGDPVIAVEHIKASDSLTNDTVRVRVKTVAGGDLAGATVVLYCHFIEQASGGITVS